MNTSHRRKGTRNQTLRFNLLCDVRIFLPGHQECVSVQLFFLMFQLRILA